MSSLLLPFAHRTLYRKDAVKVVESVMDKSPELITGDLPRWLANHSFDQISDYTHLELLVNMPFNI